LLIGGILSGSTHTAQAKQRLVAAPSLTASPTAPPSPTVQPIATDVIVPSPSPTVTAVAAATQRPQLPALPTLRSIFAAGAPVRAVPTISPTVASEAPEEPVQPALDLALRSPLATPTAPEQIALDIWSLLPTPTPTASPAPIAELLAQPLPVSMDPQTGATVEALLPTPTATPQPAPIVAPAPDGTERSVNVPVLMYHYLSVPPPGANIYRQDLSVSPELFAAHLGAMQQAGYIAISPYDLLAHLAQGAALPEKPVLITFDDGYRDNYENAFPLLSEHNMTAVFFVVTDFIDEQRPEYFTWDMLREMSAAGMSIESHGRNHVSLAGKDADYLIWQALGSLETIQYELGVRPRFVSYPAGEYDRSVIDIFRSAGYWAGFTTMQGATHSSDDLFQLRRVRVRGTTTPEELLRLLALDW
jgi:peptidoglycan/xylan/chitin deacetylase (PgdA/CDA1 family)